MSNLQLLKINKSACPVQVTVRRRLEGDEAQCAIVFYISCFDSEQ